MTTAGAEQRQLLEEFVPMARNAAGGNLLSVVLYGSAVSPEFSARYSDLNLLCLFQRLEAEELAAMAPVVRWWQQRRQPPALLFTVDELRRSADVFAIELHDIKVQHRILYGDDFVSAIEVPMKLHRVQVERELRTSMVRLRQSFAAVSDDDEALLQLMVSSSSTFHTLFRHTLIAMGAQPPGSRREVLEQLEAALGIDAAPLRAIVAVREGTISGKDLDVRNTFAGYLRALNAAADEVDRRLPR